MKKDGKPQMVEEDDPELVLAPFCLILWRDLLRASNEPGNELIW